MERANQSITRIDGNRCHDLPYPVGQRGGAKRPRRCLDRLPRRGEHDPGQRIAQHRLKRHAAVRGRTLQRSDHRCDVAARGAEEGTSGRRGGRQPIGQRLGLRVVGTLAKDGEPRPYGQRWRRGLQNIELVGDGRAESKRIQGALRPHGASCSECMDRLGKEEIAVATQHVLERDVQVRGEVGRKRHIAAPQAQRIGRHLIRKEAGVQLQAIDAGRIVIQGKRFGERLSCLAKTCGGAW